MPYRRDVLNRICSYIQWIATNTEQYENIKSKHVHDECATNERPGNLLCIFKWKAEKKQNEVNISLAPQLKIKKKPKPCYHLVVKSKYCANVLTKGRCKMQLPNEQEHFYLAVCWHTGCQLTLWMLRNEEGRLTKLFALGRSFPSVLHVLSCWMCCSPVALALGLCSLEEPGLCCCPACCEPRTEPVGWFWIP